MELAGSAYLYNLSVLAITYAAVSALVMLVRQTMGGKLSDFDIYLIGAYVSFGFAIAFDAVLPPLVALFGAPVALVWTLASGIAALILGVNLTVVIVRRLKAAQAPLSPVVMASYALHGIVVVLLVVNALIPAIRSSGLFAASLTLCLGNMMWVFVRRVSSLLGTNDRADWDPRRG